MGKSLKILVVDDDKDAADSLMELFEMDGHDVEVAYSGETAIEAYRNSDFDVAFMDIMMPGKNGVESFFEIRSMKPNARVFMMTGFSVEQLVQQAIDNGAMGVLSKPIDLDRILSVLDDVKPSGVVLIAQDDPDFAPQLVEMIEEGGYQCRLAHDGAEALSLIKKGDIDYLVLDMKLPVIDGIGVCKALRESGQMVPTVIITGSNAENTDTVSAMRDVAVTGILNKPFDPSKLIAELNKIAA